MLIDALIVEQCLLSMVRISLAIRVLHFSVIIRIDRKGIYMQ